MILRQRQIDYNKEFKFSFGEYVQAFTDMDPKNSPLPHSIDAIYLRANGTLQGGHQVMDLQTGQMSRRVYCKSCKMMHLVIQQVDALAEKQGYKSLKFLNWKKELMLLNPIEIFWCDGPNL